MKLTREESKHLDNLYKRANEIDDDIHWNKVNQFLIELGKKYNYDHMTHVIDTHGNIYEEKRCYICNNTANTYKDCIYDRVKDGNDYISKPICPSCYKNKYPKRAMKELIKK